MNPSSEIDLKHIANLTEVAKASPENRKRVRLEQLRAMEKPNLPGYLVLGRREGGNTFALGTIERSFSLDTHPDRTQFFWSSENASSNFGGSFVVDGKSMAEKNARYWNEQQPEYRFEVFDVHDPECPVLMDWDEWRRDDQPANTLSGVQDKFGSRNVRFYDPQTLED